MNEVSCVFCNIVSGQTPTEIVYEDAEVVAFNDVNPKAPTHVLIVPRKHIESVSQASKGDQILLGKLIYAAKTIAEKMGVTESGYRLQINNGKDAGQVVSHLHVHFLAGRKL